MLKLNRGSVGPFTALFQLCEDGAFHIFAMNVGTLTKLGRGCAFHPQPQPYTVTVWLVGLPLTSGFLLKCSSEYFNKYSSTR